MSALQVNTERAAANPAPAQEAGNRTAQINYLAQTCSMCQNEMSLEMGDVIYGEKWYHSSCWDLFEKTILPR